MSVADLCRSPLVTVKWSIQALSSQSAKLTSLRTMTPLLSRYHGDIPAGYQSGPSPLELPYASERGNFLTSSGCSARAACLHE